MDSKNTKAGGNAMNEKVSFEDLGLSFSFIEGETIGNLAVRCGIFLDQPCGGQGLCKKCGIFANGKYVLACQTKAEPGMSIKFIDNDDRLKILETTKSIDPATSGSSQSLGVAIDIGTTTLVVYLLDLKSGALLGISSAANPQISLGADVISRIGYIGENREGLHILHRLLIDKLNAMFVNVTQKAGINSIKKVIVAGNTTMERFSKT